MDVQRSQIQVVTREKLSEALPSLDRQCLAVLAGIGRPQNRTALATRLQRLGVRHPTKAARQKPSRREQAPEGRSISSLELKAMLERLRDQRMVDLVAGTGEYWVCTGEGSHAGLGDPSCAALLASLAAEPDRAPEERWRYREPAEEFEREIAGARLAFYAGRTERGSELLAEAADSAKRGGLRVDPWRRLFPPRTPAAAVSILPVALRARCLQGQLLDGFEGPSLCAPDLLALAAQSDDAGQLGVQALALMQCVLRDQDHDQDTDALEAQLAVQRTPLALEARALCALRRGAFADARELAAAAFEASRGPKGKRKPSLSGPLSPLLTLALATGGPAHAAIASLQLDANSRGQYIPANYLGVYLFLNEVPVSTARFASGLGYLDGLGLMLAAAFGCEVTGSFEKIGESLRRQLVEGGAHWLAAQVEVLARLLRDPAAPRAGDASAAGGSLVELHRPEAAWARALTRLEAQFVAARSTERATSRAASDQPTKRLVFLVRLSRGSGKTHAAEGDDDDDFDDDFDDDDFDDDFDDDDFDDDDFDDFDDAGDGDDFALDAILERSVPRPVRNTQGRAGWDDDSAPCHLSIEPRLQTRRGAGWTGGRAVALRTLATDAPELDYLAAHDQPMLARITGTRDWHGVEYRFEARAALGLCGHPHVFWSDDAEGPAVEVVARPPRLRVERSDGGVRLRVEPAPNAAGLAFERDLAGRLVVVDFSQAQQNLQRTIAELPPIPAEGEERLRGLLSSLALGMTVHSELGIDASGAEALETVAAECRPVVQLQRAEPGLRVRLRVQPLGPDGPEFAAGAGLSSVTFEIARRRVQCERDLQAEQAALSGLLRALPQLEPARAGAQLVINRLEDCLQLLRGLSELGDAVLAAWPDGKPVAVVAAADLSSLKLSVATRGEWLAASGTLRVDEALVLDLVAALEQRTADGSFLALGDDRYLALSSELAQQLTALQTASSASAPATKDGLRLSPIALGFVSPWLRALQTAGGLKLDRRAKSQLSLIEDAYASTPELPSTFEGELRAYQYTGYQFLYRLASFGAGACLADDMGLGKTPMTLALLIARAPLGPALCVTPVSVRGNWFDEALRFAPTLRMRRLDGADAIDPDQLEAFDVLVCSYAVMALRIEQLEHVRWSTLVLDEAQAIKNGATQRAMAARRLVADARIALTGTPVENHLGDLHGIMSFLNPGLLGSAKHFEQRFGKPIQRDADARAAEQLRSVIAPFMLRRRKSEVLRELPPRTEITLRIEPDEREQAFSEALRRSALARLREPAAAAGGSAISILAEITRLRRAACHPQLIDAQADVGAAKLERLIALAQELREGGHRALVFSQFVDFLTIVRQRLAAEGFSCQYLDGSTAEAARRKAVTAFQAGDGDLFLISLKAGGFGLNLTAADYVIHLDPWWNPAVEAQASDRAHRIGQERPVTIYRLVNATSIEERVLALHERKQALAEELLRESGDATRLDPAALMALLEG
jgi:hypothetical protein